MEEKTILGLLEEITIYGSNGTKEKVKAKIDTGADNSSIDNELAAIVAAGPIVKTKSIVSSHGRSLRPVVSLTIELAGKKITEDFTLYNRTHMSRKVLIGKNILRKGFLIDPSLERE